MIIDKSKILKNIQLAEGIWQMTFKSERIAEKYLGAGQFVSILASDNWEHPIRRPMSIADIREDQISIIYKVFGQATKTLTTLKSGEYIDVLGPLGNTYSVDDNKYFPILIGGGIGLSPILNLSKYLNQKDIKHITIIGAKTGKEQFLKHDPANSTFLCTDDGSMGIEGTVIDALKIALNDMVSPKVFACGPKQMLVSLQTLFKEKNIPAQFSVESYMACGIGFCQGCAISKEQDNDYFLVCKDGPVFESNEVSFD